MKIRKLPGLSGKTVETHIERNYTAGIYKSTQSRQTALRRAEIRYRKTDNLSNSVIYTVYGEMMRSPDNFSSNVSAQFSVQCKRVTNGT